MPEDEYPGAGDPDLWPVPLPGHPAGPLGIIHPFPSALVSTVVGALVLLAGGSLREVVMLAGAMLAFQASIGATNDLVDAPRDLITRAPKPLPAGQISVTGARAVAVAGGVVALGLSLVMGPGVFLVGLAGYACGIGYDVWLRTRGLAWLAYVVAFPLLLAYAWLGAAGALPPAWELLLPMAGAVGLALAVSNSLIDVDRDVGDPAGGLAARLGQRRSLVLLAGLLVVVHVGAWVMAGGSATTDSAHNATSPPMWAPEGRAGFGLLVAAILSVIGLGLQAAGTRRARSAGWTLQAIAIAILGVAWVAVVRA